MVLFTISFINSIYPAHILDRMDGNTIESEGDEVQGYSINPTSEVGSAHSRSQPSGSGQSLGVMTDLFKFAMTEIIDKINKENRETINSMINLMQPIKESRVRIADVYFPAFDPDNGLDVREWVNLISKTQVEYDLKDHEVRLKAASVLQGRAKIWADDSLLRTTTWEEMSRDMLETFEPESRYFSDVLKYRSYSIEKAADIPEFISNIWRMFRRIVKPNPSDADAVEFVIGSIDDEKIRTELLNSKSQTVPELIAIAKTLRKRKFSEKDKDLMAKRPKLDYSRRVLPQLCFACGKPGHRARDCKVKAQTVTMESQSAGNDLYNFSKTVCAYCSKAGHTLEKCFKRMESERNKTVSLCHSDEVPTNVIKVKFGNQEIDCMFDSGADCSLVREKTAMSLPGKKISVVKCLKGIKIPVFSSTQIRTMCTIDDITIELELYVVLDHEIPVDVLIGRNLFETPGLMVEMSSTFGVKISRSSEDNRVLQIREVEFDL